GSQRPAEQVQISLIQPATVGSTMLLEVLGGADKGNRNLFGRLSLLKRRHPAADLRSAGRASQVLGVGAGDKVRAVLGRDYETESKLQVDGITGRVDRLLEGRQAAGIGCPAQQIMVQAENKRDVIAD